MASVDYYHTAEDHQSFLVLIRHAGKQLSWKQFSRCWERICQNTCVAVPGQKRDMWIRYRRSYSKENNEWGDIQAHRKVLGLICIGKCSNEKEFEDLFQSYKNEKSEYSDTLFNSRLFVYGMNKDGSALTEDETSKYEGISPEKQLTMKIDDGVGKNDSCDTTSNVNSENDKNSNGRTNFQLDPLRRAQSPVMNQSEKKVKKTQSEASVTILKRDSKPPPIKESKPFSTSQKKPSSTSQLNKDTPGSEVVFFPRLDNYEDELEESVREFVTSLFFVLEGKRLDRSFERADRQQLLCAPFEKKDYVGIDPDSKSYRKKCQGRLRKHLADLCLLAGLPGEAILHYTTAIDILKPVNDWLWMGACYEGLCSAAVVNCTGPPQHVSTSLRRNQSFSTKRGVSAHNKQIEKHRAGSIMNHTGSYANGMQNLSETAGKSTLNSEDITEKYKEAMALYGKYKNSGIIEMETGFKAARVLIQQKKYLHASEFLQNVVYINLQLSDDDRINRYSVLSSLYDEIGFQRKASFFRRVAAMQCVSPQNPKQNWHLCHQLLVQSLAGYNIYFDPKEGKVKSGCVNGWPVIQTRVLHELIYSARRMGNLPIAIRYTTMMLYTLLDQLGPQDKRDVVVSLEGLTSQCEGTTQPLALESGVIIPPVPLLNVPLVKSFKLSPLHPHLEPRKLNIADTSAENVFIFTPMNLNKAVDVNKTDVDFCWVEGDMCEIQLQVVNPMPDELKVSHMGLLCEGVELETFPSSPTIAAESGPYPVKIMSRPTSSGELTILGYTSKVYGVKSNCKLRDCPSIIPPYYKVKVIASLPQIQVSTSLPKSASFLSFGEEFNVVTSATTVLFTGQSCECVVTVQNNGKLPVELIKTSLESARESKDIMDEVFQWSPENIDSQLPLQTTSLLCFSLALYGVGDCLPLGKGLQRSSDSPSRHISKEGKSVEALLKLEYSGGPGLTDNYCRCCSIAFIIDVQPSIVFHKWDVLPAESADHCYLVFDIQNQSGNEIEIQYETDEIVELKNDQIRRISIQIARCQPLKPDLGVNSFSMYLATFVDIRWKMPSLKVHGKASIEYLQWTAEQQQLVYASPMSWDIRLNGNVFSPLHIGSSDFKVGETVEIEAELNISIEMLNCAGAMCIWCFQDCDNGCVNEDTSQSVTPLGAESTILSQMTVDEPILHSCSYLFSCAGSYRFEFFLKVIQGRSEGQSSDILNVGLQQGQKPNEGHGFVTLNKGEGCDTNVQIWKCSSVIKVKVSN